MELSQAFGNFFREEAPIVEVKKPKQKPAPVQKPVSEPVQKTESRRDLGMRYLGSQPGFIDPQFYMINICLLYTSPSPRDLSTSRMPSSA